MNQYLAMDVLTVDEIAIRMKCDKRLIYREIKEGRLYAKQIGKRLVVPVAAFHAWLFEQGPEGQQQ